MSNSLQKRLSKRELDVMEALWNTEQALSAYDLAENLQISRSTIQTTLQNLYEKGYINVESVVTHKTSIARQYRPVFSVLNYFQTVMPNSSLQIASQAVENASSLEEIEELEKILAKKKEEILGK